MMAATEADTAKKQADVKRWRILVFALVIVALVLRITAAVAVERHVQTAGRQFLIDGDANGYWELGQRLAAGDEYLLYSPPRRVMRMPGLPMLLGASISLFGDSVLAARVVLAVVGALCCWLTYLLGRLLHTRRVGFWAALFVSVNPLHVGNSVLILSETWFTFWMLLSLIALIRLLDPHDLLPADGSWLNRRLTARAATVGIAVGLTTLTRPGFLPWLGISAIVLWLVPQSGPSTSDSKDTDGGGGNKPNTWARRLLLSSVMVSTCVLTLLPWALRNQSITGHLVFTSLWSGPSLYDGLNPEADGGSNMQFFEDDHVLAHMTEFDMNRHYSNRAIKFAVENPTRAVSLAITKAGLYLDPRPNFAKRKGWAVGGVCVVFWVALFGLCAAGLVSREWEFGGLVVMAGPVLMFLLVHMVFVGSVRYRLPLEFPLSVLSAIGWRWLILGRRKSATSDHGSDTAVVNPGPVS